MKTAVIKTGGKQYIVAEGDAIRVEKLAGEKGTVVSFSDVFLVADGDTVAVGTPIVSGAKVEGVVEEQGRADKVIGIKYKPKVRYRKKFGHRQEFTKVKITKIT